MLSDYAHTQRMDGKKSSQISDSKSKLHTIDRSFEKSSKKKLMPTTGSITIKRAPGSQHNANQVVGTNSSREEQLKESASEKSNPFKNDGPRSLSKDRESNGDIANNSSSAQFNNSQKQQRQVVVHKLTMVTPQTGF